MNFCSGSGADATDKKKSAGPEDLRLALRRLSLRRQNNLSERRFFEEERAQRRRGHGLGLEGGLTPSDSIMSLGSLPLWATRGPYLPDKLQIVKPLEGEERAGPRGRGQEGAPSAPLSSLPTFTFSRLFYSKRLTKSTFAERDSNISLWYIKIRIEQVSSVHNCKINRTSFIIARLPA